MTYRTLIHTGIDLVSSGTNSEVHNKLIKFFSHFEKYKPAVNMDSTVNPDLHGERQNATFDTEIMSRLLYGGVAKLQRQRHICKLHCIDL